jgi:membrane fusion protein, multidrug efflux system
MINKLPYVTFALLVCLAPAIVGAADMGKVRAQVTSRQQTTLSAEISAKVLSLPVREGDSFNEGQQLIVFDCSILEAQRDKAKASADAAEETLKVNKRLSDLGSISTLELEQSAAKLREAQADFTAVSTMASKCTLSAPFAGRVAKLYIEAHQYMTPGKSIMDIIDTHHLEVRLIVPSTWLSWLKVGAAFTIHVDELSRSFQARVAAVNPRVDPVSQSVSLIGEIMKNDSQLLPGMSGWVTFQRHN